MTKGKFGFHRGGSKHEPSPAADYVQIYVKSSALSPTPDLAISAHLMTEAEIDDFVNDANHRVGGNPFRCQEGASRGGFTLGFPKAWLKPAETSEALASARGTPREPERHRLPSMILPRKNPRRTRAFEKATEE